MTKLEFGPEAHKVAGYLERELPAVTFTFWDLAPLIPKMHNLRRNMVFVECDQIAVESVADLLGKKFPDFQIYAGIRKPVVAFKRAEAKSSVVVVARDAKVKLGVEGKYPKIEKCLVDLLYYAKNDYLPISMWDVVDLWRYYFKHAEAEGLHFNELYRYSMRRYLSWFVSVFAYSLSKNEEFKLDPRHLSQGKKNMELFSLVNES